MKKFTPVVLFLSLTVVFTPISQAQSRARRVEQSAPPSPNSSTNRNADHSPVATETSEEVGEEEIVRVSTTLVTVPVSIMDRDGKYIPDLQKEDFRIFEDGIEQEVAYFTTTEKPFTVALIIDTSNSTAFKLEDIQDAAIAFVNQLRPDDRVLVVSFDDKIRTLAEATNDRAILRQAIRRTRTGGSTKLYDAVDWVIKQRFNYIEGRKAIVLFTDGVDTTSKRASYESTVHDAEELDALIYPVQYDTYDGTTHTGPSWPNPTGRNSTIRIGSIAIPLPFPGPRGGGGGGGGGTGTSRGEYELGGRYLRELADKTGGRVHQARDLRYLTQSFTAIAEELRRQYVLGYYPKNQARTSARRQIKVRAHRPNITVRTRDSYIYKPSMSDSTTTQDKNAPPSQSPPVLRKRQLTREIERGVGK